MGSVRIADGATAVDLLATRGFDPHQEMIVPGGVPVQSVSSWAGEAEILELKPDRVRVRAHMSGPGYVVLVDTFDPGWRATLDGRTVPILRANIAFRAVAVPAGAHEVVMLYRPKAVTLGLLISAVTLCLVLAWAVWRLVRTRRVKTT